MVKLTKRTIDQTNAKERDIILWDDSLPGFGIRIKPSGVKTFIVQYRNEAGRSRRGSVGKHGVLTLAEARKQALRLLAGASSGDDPVEERQELRRCATVTDLFEQYMSGHCEGRCKPSTIRANKWTFLRILEPRIGNRKLVEIRQADISKMHSDLRDKPYNANRGLQLIRAMLNWAERQEMIPPHSNPAARVKLYPEPKRERFLSPEELYRLMATIGACEADGDIDIYMAAAIRLLLFTGCRVGEILSLQWACVDMREQRLTITEHKTSKYGAKIIPLNPPAFELLENLPRQEGNPFVIGGRRPGSGLINIQKPWRRVRVRAELEDVRLHDLRHTFASFAVSAGISLPLIGGLLGHRSMQATARYAHLAHHPLKLASDKVADVFVVPTNGDEKSNSRLQDAPAIVGLRLTDIT